jgi:hypothetical protein
MDVQTMVAFHRKLQDNGIATCEFDDVDRSMLTYVYSLLKEMQDLKEIRLNLRKRVGELEEQVATLRSHRKILRRVVVTAGLPDPFGKEDDSGEIDALDQTQVQQRLLETCEMEAERRRTTPKPAD